MNLDGNLNGNQTGTKLGPNCNQKMVLGVHWRLLAGPWDVPWGSLGGAVGDPSGPGHRRAPGTPKVPRVYNCRHKQAGGQTGRDEALPDFGTA